MNVEKDLLKDGIVVTEKIDTETILNITKNISKKIVNTFPNFDLNADEIFSKLFSLNMYRANEDLEEFAIHECIHFLQEVKNNKNKIKKMGLSKYYKFKTKGIGLNEAAVQYISAKIIGIPADYEKYYNINLCTPSPSYYPVICALLNELVYFVGEDILFKSTYFSTDDFKNSIVKRTSKKIFEAISYSFDNILNYEEQIITLNNKALEQNDTTQLQELIEKYRENINITFMQTQNLIIQEFFNAEYNNLSNLEQLDNFRRNLDNFRPLIGTTENYTFFEDYYTEMMNKLEHKSNILENGGTETALETKKTSIHDLFCKIADMLFYKDSYLK